MFDLYIDLKKNKVYTVMEYIDKLDLQKHLEANGRFEGSVKSDDLLLISCI